MELMPISLLMMLCLGIHRSSSDILQRQKRNWIIDSFSIEEENKGPFPYSLGMIEVEKKFTLLKLNGQGVEMDPKNILQVNSETGEVTVHGKVDYEQYNKLELTFEAHDTNKNVVDTRLGVEVQILDINDNPPIFERQTYEIDLKESTSQGTFLLSVKAMDGDNSATNNGTFDMRIVSVTPKPSDVEFSIKQNDETGAIEFKGCLDYEKAEKYTILVEAKDRGEEIQLSSTCTVIINIEDGNNHLPVFTGQTGPGRVKERVENVLVLRLQVSDKDTKGTAAWRAKYEIQGDTNNNFRITTDPDTNEGLLYVDKHLDYETDSLKNLTVRVENEGPYYSCKVLGRPTTGLWNVETISSKSGLVPPLPTRHVTVSVEDVNEPPIFTNAVRDVTVEENTAVGHYLETFTAIDLDGTYANEFVYMKEEDPADWITVDSKTGKITTAKIMDRESPFVKDNIYNVTIRAVDSGVPPMTGTGTLNIHLKDQNDNLPTLVVNTMDMCLSDAPSLANITAFDHDGDPYSGPFRFKLLGDVKDKWRVDPDNGYLVNLVKENTVHAGHHELLLEVSDLQGQPAVHNLSVTVCNCKDPMKPNCRNRRAAASTVGGGAIGIIFAAMLLLLGILLLAFLLSCKRENKPMPDGGSGEYLMPCNTESMGTDCKVVLHKSNQGYSQNEFSTKKMKPVVLHNFNQGYSQNEFSTKKMKPSVTGSATMGAGRARSEYSMYQGNSVEGGQYRQGNSVCRSTMTSGKYSTWGESGYLFSREVLLKTLGKMMYTLQAPGEELGDYAPNLYAEEGETGTDPELDAISIPEIPFDTDMVLDLGPKFNTLASVCGPDATAS
ncbi:cadherin-2-like isoform X2 [Centroberyx affinis]|uniref:cadherin-2-like isoform X2 n=1 Tax=Centroberyx affinis TaxID=166261 RepID=UPI003A5C3A6D